MMLVTMFWVVLTAMLFLDFRFSSKVDLVTTCVAFALFCGVAVVGFVKGHAAALAIPPTGSWLFPYGLILYALVGPLAIPEVIRLLRMERVDPRRIKGIAIVGTVLTAAVYLAFALGVFLMSGARTTPDAITGLTGAIPNGLLYLTMLMALLEIGNSYFMFQTASWQTFRRDFRFPKWIAFAVIVFVPVALFAFGARDFLKLMGFSGAVFLTIDAVFTVLMYRKLKRVNPGYRYQILSLPRWVPALMVVVFLVGSVASLLGGT
jgi:hypothetical protein